MRQADLSCPALLVTAPASGQGKTTITLALARLLARRNWRVTVFKCGPDFLDPLWLGLASGQVARNLDLWMMGADAVREELYRAAASSDVILVEGVMGLHDACPSTADLARLAQLPVLAVIQAGAMAETIGAVASGLRSFRSQTADTALRWAGVLANGVSGTGHAALLAAALPATEWLGHVPSDPSTRLPERALGLIHPAAADKPAATQLLDRAADLLQATPLGAMNKEQWQARWSVEFKPADRALPRSDTPLSGKTIAIAQDAAFPFVYAANRETLEGLGARLTTFSPLAGDALPPCDALWLPGGFPEQYAAQLSRCTELRAQIQQHVSEGRPLWAEGGGLLALLEDLIDVQGRRHPMWGVIPGHARMTRGLAAFGLQQWALPSMPGASLRGHCFHHAQVETNVVAFQTARTRSGPAELGGPGEPIYCRGSVRASLFHPWFGSSPLAAAALFGAGTPDRNL